MKLQEKLDYLQTNYMGEWLKTRQKIWDELSEKYPIICVCGRLCTGLYENNCRKLQNKITSETIKELKYLLKNKGLKWITYT